MKDRLERILLATNAKLEEETLIRTEYEVELEQVWNIFNLISNYLVTFCILHCCIAACHLYHIIIYLYQASLALSVAALRAGGENRYSTSSPYYEENKVELTDMDEGSNSINANWVGISGVENKFILTLAPLSPNSKESSDHMYTVHNHPTTDLHTLSLLSKAILVS